VSDTPIDRLIFALDGDLGPYNATLGQAEAMTDRSAARISDKWKNVALGMGDLGGQKAFKATASGASELERALGGVSLKAEEARRNLIASSGAGAAMTALFRDIAKVAPASMLTASEGIRLTQRELWHLSAAAREIATGQFSRLPITAAVIAAHFGGLTAGTLALGAAVLTIPVAFGVAAYQTEQALARIRSALAITGYASGITASQAGQIAASISAGSGGTYSQLGGRGLVGQLAGNLVPGASIARAGIAATQYELGAGVSEKDAVKIISDMFADPTKSAQQLDREMNLLTFAQTEQVRRLQEQGEYEKAGDLILQAFSDRTREAANQANYFAIMLAKAEGGVGGFLDFLGKKVLGMGLTPQEELKFLQGGGQKYSYGVIPEYDTASRAARIAELQRQIAEEATRAKSGQQARAIFDAYPDAARGADQFNAHVRDLTDRLAKANKALAENKGVHNEYIDGIRKEKTALEGALKPGVQRTAVQIAQEEAADRLRVARAAPEHQATVAAQLAAKRTLERNLASGTMLPADAQAIFRAQMQGAAAGDIKAGQRLDQRIKDLLAEASAAETVAKAFDESVAAGDRAKAAGEAHVMVVKKEIAASMEMAATNAILAKSFATLSAAESERIAKEALAVAALRAEAAAGGSPIAQAIAGARAAATAETAPEFAAANAMAPGPDQVNALAEAGDHFNKALANNIAKLDAAAQRAAASQLFRLQTDINTTQQRAGLLAQGGTQDDLRRLEAAQAAVEELSRTTDVYAEKNRALVESMMDAAVAASDLNDAYQKNLKEASDLASGITGPLDQFLNYKTSFGNMLK